MLFESVKQEEGPARERETTFEFLQRDGQRGAAERREWMEEWFREMPFAAQSKLENRLKGGYLQFLSALFEMEVYRVLRRLNHSVEFEPNIPGTRKRIDFLANREGQSFYVEAAVCGVGQGGLSGNSNEHDAVEKIRKNIGSLHSDILLEAAGELNTSLGRECVVGPFRNLLSRYTAEEILEIYSRQGYAGAPSIEIKKGNWILKGRLMPPVPLLSQGQIWGPMRGGAIDGVTPLWKALLKKVKDWKRDDFQGRPFLIAINVCHPEFLWEDIESVLFEDSNLAEDDKKFRHCLSRVSGVMVFGNAVLGRECDAPVELYRNGNMPIPDSLRFLLQKRKLGDLLGIGS